MGYFSIRGPPVIIMMISLLLICPVPARGQNEKWVVFEDYDGMHITAPDIIEFTRYDRINVEVTVTSGEPVDVYLLSEKEYQKYTEGEKFKTEIGKQRVNHTKFEWENPESGNYYLVIDNIDNIRDNDAVPYDEVTYTYTAPIEERHHEVIMIQKWIGGAIAAVLVIIIFVVWLMIYKKSH